MDELLNKSNPTLKIFFKKMKIKKDYLPILIDFKIRFVLLLVLLMTRNMRSILLKLCDKPFQHLNILYISKNIPLDRIG